MKDLVTPKQVAQAINVSESSLKRWCDQGLIPTVRTAGGHRRLPVNGVLAFLRDSGYQLVAPEILGLPPATQGGHDRKLAQQRERLIAAFLQGDEQVCVEVVLNLYLARIPMSAICDDLLAGAIEAIGEKCGCGDVQVYQERRSCELCYRVMHEVRRALPEPAPQAPIAVGGTLDADPYALPSSMTELVLRENGWRACSLGSMLPFLSLRQAVCDMRPLLCWMSVSTIRDRDAFLDEFSKLSQLCEENRVALVVSGKALSEELLEKITYCAHAETFDSLEAFARRVVPDTSHPQRIHECVREDAETRSG